LKKRGEKTIGRIKNQKNFTNFFLARPNFFFSQKQSSKHFYFSTLPETETKEQIIKSFEKGIIAPEVKKIFFKKTINQCQ